MDEELEKLRGDHKLPTKELLSRIWKYLKPEIGWFILAFLVIVLNIACDSVLPILMQDLVDHLQLAAEKIVLTYIISMAVGYLILTIVNQAFLYIESMILQKSGQRVVYKLRMEVFEHIENMSIAQLNEMPVGSLVTRVANYTAAMSDLFTDTLVQFIRNILTAVIVYIIMIVICWQLSLIMLGFIIVILVITYFFRKSIHKEFTEERALMSNLNSFLSENLSGMKLTQLFNQENRKRKDFGEINDAYRKKRYKVTSLFAFYRPSVHLLNYLSIALSFYLGVKFGLTAGAILAYYLYIEKFFNPVMSLADSLNRITRARTAADRIFNLLDVKPQILDSQNAVDIDHFEGKIEFKNVWFAYEDENWILKDVSFVIEPHQTAAFVGATGAGKTTILSLLVRNYEIQKGQILIDDIDIKDIKIDSLRRKVGQMLQDVFLFSGSIRSNITLHDDSFSDEEINEACRYVNADSFVSKLDKGLDSEIVERGENLSQGQRQLLSFARTVLHKPQILILDEATANIDTETEKLIQESLEKMKNIGTMLIVAHRLSTIQKADQIICLQNGEIVEKGRHQELLKLKGYYYKLYQLQFEESN